MKKICLPAILIFFAIWLSGCARIFLLAVFNNAGTQINVISVDTQGNEKLYTIEAGHSKRIACPSKLTIKCKEHIWHYSPKAIPGSYAYNTAANRRIVSVQIQDGGSVYVLPPKTKIIAEIFPLQPDGYPLKPER